MISKSTVTAYSKAMLPYILFDASICLLQVLATGSERLSPSLQMKTFARAAGLLKGDECGDNDSFDHFGEHRWCAMLYDLSYVSSPLFANFELQPISERQSII